MKKWKRLGADLPPPWVLKGPKSAGFNRVKGKGLTFVLIRTLILWPCSVFNWSKFFKKCSTGPQFEKRHNILSQFDTPCHRRRSEAMIPFLFIQLHIQLFFAIVFMKKTTTSNPDERSAADWEEWWSFFYSLKLACCKICVQVMCSTSCNLSTTFYSSFPLPWLSWMPCCLGPTTSSSQSWRASGCWGGKTGLAWSLQGLVAMRCDFANMTTYYGIIKTWKSSSNELDAVAGKRDACQWFHLRFRLFWRIGRSRLYR